MINKKYREAALLTYGDTCELCGHRVCVEVHHIDYIEHQVMEQELRNAQKAGQLTNDLLLKAKNLGYDFYDVVTKQLSKNDSTLNTSVLCGNCHSQCHLIDYGKKILRALKPRR